MTHPVATSPNIFCGCGGRTSIERGPGATRFVCIQCGEWVATLHNGCEGPPEIELAQRIHALREAHGPRWAMPMTCPKPHARSSGRGMSANQADIIEGYRR